MSLSHRTFSAARLVALLLGLAALLAAEVALPRVPKDQRQAAEAFLGAVATGDPTAVAYAIHPADLEALRNRLLTMMREEAEKGDFTIRSRLFGKAMSLAEIERLTPISFYATLARKLYITARQYRDAEYVAAVPDRDGLVHVLLWGRQPKEHGKVEVLNVVTIKPYGEDWKAALPSEIEAQIEDLINGRRSMTASGPSMRGAGSAPAGGGDAVTPLQITEMLQGAEKALADQNCEEYYQKYMSPNFRRVTSKNALEALIASCKNSLATREMLLSTVRIAQGLTPKLLYQGQRAVYDLSGQGLPFERFVLEQVDKKWYIAE